MKLKDTLGLIVSALILFTIGCQQIQNQMRVEPNDVEQNENQYWGDVFIGDVDHKNDKFGNDYFVLNSVTIIGDMLTINVSVSSCDPQTNKFTLVTSVSFLESFPVQLKVSLAHMRNTPCDEEFIEDYHFDLTPIKTMYQQAYRQEAGTIILRLKDAPDEELTYKFAM
jgi:hypothetical protein